MKDTPIPSIVSQESRDALSIFWAQYVTALNPNQALPQVGRNPASLPFDEQLNSKEHLTERLNRYQRHSNCTTTYCLRKHKVTGEVRCRFYFPQPQREVATVSREQNPQFYKFLPERNDSKLNQYVHLLTMSWNATTDFAPCTSTKSVVNYIAKHASKSEVKSKSYQEIFAGVTARDSINRSFQSTATRVINALIGERDWSAQEVTHHLLGLDLVSSSRDTIALDMRPPGELQSAIQIDIAGDLVKQGESWLEKYQERQSYRTELSPEVIHSVTLFEFSQFWQVVNQRITRRPRAPARVLNIFPAYSP